MALERDAVDAEIDGEDAAGPANAQTLSFAETITVVVGEQKRKYTMPVRILIRDSPFFKVASSERWNKNEEPIKGTIDLTNHPCEAFELYLQILTNESVLIDCIRPNRPEHNDVPQYGLLLDLYILAHLAQNLGLCNRISDCWTALTKEGRFPLNADVFRMFQSLPSEDPLVRLCIAELCNHKVSHGDVDGFLGHSECPPGLVKELLRRFWKLSSLGMLPSSLIDGHACKFHHHDDYRPGCAPDKENEDITVSTPRAPSEEQDYHTKRRFRGRKSRARDIELSS